MLTFFQSSHKPFSASCLIWQAQLEFSSCFPCADMRSWFPGNIFLRICEARKHIIPQELPLKQHGQGDGLCVRSQTAALVQNKHPAALQCWDCSRRTEQSLGVCQFHPLTEPVQWEKPLMTSQRSYVLRQQDPQKHSHRIMAIWGVLAMIPFDAK